MRNAIRKIVLIALLLICSGALGAERFVLISTSPDSGPDSDLRTQLVAWAQSGMISKLELFESDGEEESRFQLFGILRFYDEQALHSWNATVESALPSWVQRTEVELLAELGSSPYETSGSVFQIMQYDVLVDRMQFEAYIDGYQLPEMRARRSLGGLTRYSSYYALPGSTAPWQSLIVLEYKNAQAFEESKELNKKLGEQLALEDLRFNEFKQTKHSLRKKTATTRAHWLVPPISTTNQ